MEMKQEKSCGAVIYRDGENGFEWLLIRQNQGHWCFPKGHVKDGESEHETASREVKEETGLDIGFVDGYRATTVYSPEEGVMKEVVYFLGQPCGGEEMVQAEELSEMRWCSNIDAAALITYDSDTSLLRKAIRFLKDHKVDPEE